LLAANPVLMWRVGSKTKTKEDLMGPWQMLGEYWWIMSLAMPLMMLTFFFFFVFVASRVLRTGLSRRPESILPVAVEHETADIALSDVLSLLKAWEHEIPASVLHPLLRRAEDLGARATSSIAAREELDALAVDLRRFDDDEKLQEVVDLRADVAAVQCALQEVRGAVRTNSLSSRRKEQT